MVREIDCDVAVVGGGPADARDDRAGRAAGVLARDEEGSLFTVRARYVVDASGQASRLRRNVGGRIHSELFRSVLAARSMNTLLSGEIDEGTAVREFEGRCRGGFEPTTDGLRRTWSPQAPPVAAR